MIQKFRWLTLVLLLTLSQLVQAQSESFENAALTWVNLLDAQDFAGSWVAAGPMFQNAVTRDEWVKQIATDRKALGVVVQRSVLSAERVYPQGVTAGEYAKVVFQANFAQAGKLQEILSMQKVDGMRWQVAGYLVK